MSVDKRSVTTDARIEAAACVLLPWRHRQLTASMEGPWAVASPGQREDVLVIAKAALAAADRAALVPIAEAPTDGTKVYLWWAGCRCMPLASWQCFEGGDENGEGFVFMWSLEDDTLLIGQEAEGWIGFEGDPRPTHFLPAPPEQD